MTSRLRNICALTLALLWMAMPLAGALHVALEEHSYCAEHQALEHGPSDDSAADRVATNQSSVTASGHAADSDHEGCAFAEDCLRIRDTRASFVVHVLAPQCQDVLARPSQTSSSPIAIISVAPKNSPPSHA